MTKEKCSRYKGNRSREKKTPCSKKVIPAAKEKCSWQKRKNYGKKKKKKKACSKRKTVAAKENNSREKGKKKNRTKGYEKNISRNKVLQKDKPNILQICLDY